VQASDLPMSHVVKILDVIGQDRYPALKNAYTKIPYKAFKDQLLQNLQNPNVRVGSTLDQDVMNGLVHLIGNMEPEETYNHNFNQDLKKIIALAPVQAVKIVPALFKIREKMIPLVEELLNKHSKPFSFNFNFNFNFKELPMGGVVFEADDRRRLRPYLYKQMWKTSLDESIYEACNNLVLIADNNEQYLALSDIATHILSMKNSDSFSHAFLDNIINVLIRKNQKERALAIFKNAITTMCNTFPHPKYSTHKRHLDASQSIHDVSIRTTLNPSKSIGDFVRRTAHTLKDQYPNDLLNVIQTFLTEVQSKNEQSFENYMEAMQKELFPKASRNGNELDISMT